MPECQDVRVLTWNANAHLECPFVQQEVQRTDILCLQEVSQVAAEGLHTTLSEEFHVILSLIHI